MEKCICNRKVEVYSEPEGFTVSCPRCGRSTPYCNTYEEAVQEWQRKGSVGDMVSEVQIVS